jgi:hypothetical protein
MLTIEYIEEYLIHSIAEDFLRSDKIGLHRTQTTAGVLMAAAESIKDKNVAFRFRQIAAQAANKIEELDEKY